MDFCIFFSWENGRKRLWRCRGKGNETHDWTMKLMGWMDLYTLLYCSIPTSYQEKISTRQIFYILYN